MPGSDPPPPRFRGPGGPRGWPRKFADARRGLFRAVRSQSSFAVHLWMAAAVVATAVALDVAAGEWCLLALSIGLVLMAEVFNTAIESLARGPNAKRHPRLRDALDMASAGVLVAALAAAVVGISLFLPKIVDRSMVQIAVR